jgi:hypothetical protein
MWKSILKLKNSEFGLILKEKLYPSILQPQFNTAMERFRVCDNCKKMSQIKKEISLYKKFWRCYPYEYFLLDLYRTDNQITEKELINYIPAFFWYKLFLPHYTSSIFSSIIQNKIFTEQIFNGLNIFQPDTLGMVINNNLYSSKMKKSTVKEILNEINSKNPNKIFVKPTEGYGGKGFYIFNKTDTGNFTSRENKIFNENFLSNIGKESDFIIQAGVTQDPEISAIYPDSVNTCRIVSENKDGNARIVCAMLRVGRNGLEVDNATSGGLCVKIDIPTGKLAKNAKSYENEIFMEHPDTHFEFQNFTIPRWNEIQRFVKDAADKLPLFVHLGWDIVLTLDGPIAIEPNVGPGIESLQIGCGGLREAFCIDDPDYYWKHLGKRR